MTEVIVNLSHRHIHLTDKDVEVLFGANKTLTKKADLLQPGQFAAQETVTISGPRGSIEPVRVVGPTRAQTQCEILTGDLYTLGYSPAEVPVRLSGDLAGSAPLTITGPAGTVTKPEGLIIAQRHIHIDPATANEIGLNDNQTVSLACTTKHKRTTLHDVVVRTQSGAIMECHIDIEEGNAASIQNGYRAEIIK